MWTINGTFGFIGRVNRLGMGVLFGGIQLKIEMNAKGVA